MNAFTGGFTPDPDGKATEAPDAVLKAERSRWLDPSECAAADPRGYIIKGLIAPGDLAIVFGAPGAGKSVITPYLAYAVAQGRSVFGRRVKQGRVLYVAAEDTHGMKARVHALSLEHKDAPNFLLCKHSVNLLVNTGIDGLRHAVEVFNPALIVVDTLAAAFSGIRENEAEDMSIVVRYLRSLTFNGAAVIVVHHCPKGGDTPRGHSVLNGDADVGLMLTRDGKTVRGSLTKNRNGPCDMALAFTIRSRFIGTDEDDDAITAPVLDEASDDEPAAKPGPKLNATDAAARQYLVDVLSRAGWPLPPGEYPADTRGVKLDVWRDECLSRGLSTSTSAGERNRTFTTVSKRLLEKRVVACRDGYVWLVRKDDGVQK
jgi:KaiC/GvpD/RAD55 family RecA-like ATPase